MSDPQFSFHCASIEDPTLRVFRFRGHESVSQPFEFTIGLVSKNADLDLAAPIGQPACLVLRGYSADGQPYRRYVHGVIERFVQIGAGTHHSRYEAKLVPTVLPLQYTRNSRIFQQLSTPDVTRRVLQDGGIAGNAISSLLHSRYEPRDYCVQYQESDLSFIARLFEEEGIFYFFEHERDRDRLVLGDGSHAFEALKGYSTVRMRDTPHKYEESLFELRAEMSLRPGTAVLRDYKFKQPSLDMEAVVKAERFTEYQMYYFPAESVDPTLVSRLAKVRLEELQCQQSQYVGRSNVRELQPGSLVTVSGHRRRECNQQYLILAVEHEGEQPEALSEELGTDLKTSYSNQVVFMPAKVAYRPPRVTDRPCIAGVQTAIVMGPPGEEIHCDKHGRVKVLFHWDRQGARGDNSSCWIRVSQPWGGMGQGGMFIPRVGQEVVVQFLEGDPDRPLIVGRVYNGENPVPHELPAGKNISTIRSASTPANGGFNEIKFDDSAGSELIYIHAQHDKLTEVGNNQTDIVGGNVSETYKGFLTTEVSKDVQQTYKAKQTTEVTGDVKETYKANQTTEVTSDVTQTYKANQTLNLTGHLKETIDGGVEQIITKGVTQTVTGEYKQTITGDTTQAITGPYTQTVSQTGNIHVTGNLDITSDAVCTITGAQHLKLHGQSWFKTSNASGEATLSKNTFAALKSDIVGMKVDLYTSKFADKGFEVGHVGTALHIGLMQIRKVAAISLISATLALSSADLDLSRSAARIRNAGIHIEG